MQSAYSWMGSRIHLVLKDEVADTYNRAMQAYFDAQKNHKELHGHQWDPVNEALLINWSIEERKAFDDMGSIINAMIEMNGEGLDIPEDEMTSDFLVKL